MESKTASDLKFKSEEELINATTAYVKAVTMNNLTPIKGHLQDSYDDEGGYALVFQGRSLYKHFSSSRSWAERDLILSRENRLEEIKKLNITRIISKNKVIYNHDQTESNLSQ